MSRGSLQPRSFLLLSDADADAYADADTDADADEAVRDRCRAGTSAQSAAAILTVVNFYFLLMNHFMFF